MESQNFIEACNSGKKFRFLKNPDWYEKNGYDGYLSMDDWFTYLCFNKGVIQTDIINGEFILEDRSIEDIQAEKKKAIDRYKRLVSQNQLASNQSHNPKQ